MLFIRSNSLPLSLDEDERLGLLDSLADAGLIPLARSARRHFFQQLTSAHDNRPADEAAAIELERQCARQRATGGPAAYTPGDLFCAGDCVLFLVFGAGAGGEIGAGIVYNIDTAGPLARLERFCLDVREACVKIGGGKRDDESGDDDENGATAAGESPPHWETRTGPWQQGLARFIDTQPTDYAVAAKFRGGARELTRASELMEDNAVRSFLRRMQEMRREGYSPRRLFAEAATLGGGDLSVERMFDAGLLEREVRVSCRKSGHALFDLPSPDSLAAITISKAKCSLCAAPVADEVVEETINPTRLAVSLLADGGWLSNRVYRVLRSLGVPDSEIASGPPSADGESHLAADVCGNSFLFVTRDGDLTPACARRVAGRVAETEATHLVVVITGAVEDEGRLRLYEFAWRRARDGRDLNITLVEGLAGARAEIERAFERAVRHELAQRLFALDPALGLSASNFVLDWFRLANSAAGGGGAAANVPPPASRPVERRIVS